MFIHIIVYVHSIAVVTQVNKDVHAPQSTLTFVVQRHVAQSGRRLQVVGPGNQNSQITPVNPLVARRERVQQELHTRSHPTGVLYVKVKIRIVVGDEISRKS